ncbi:hypothetical protein VitviT2T_030198 [Vitis vinifera]|uniref:Dynamin-type G domain-containing protein n=1 Tax=Vitis vinifera TaxID=29760 RepID=A0ABY9DZD3_VITVI|nr:hypothetical protein VitviT2T_030198 [Vitis vinifera]
MSVSLTHISWWLWSGKHQEPKRLSNGSSLNSSQDSVFASISSISVPNSPKAAALLADEDVDENSSSSSSHRGSTFLNVVALGNVGAGKSAILNNLIGHLVLPIGENGATRALICIDLQKDCFLSSKSIILQIANKSQQVSTSALRHSLQDKLSKGASGKNRDEIYLKLRTSTTPPLKLVDLPGLDQRIMDETLVSDYAQHNDAILLVIVPTAQAPEMASSRALKIAKEYDGDGTRKIDVISKIDQAASYQKILAAVQALLLNQGPRSTSEMPWVALIGQSVSIASVWIYWVCMSLIACLKECLLSSNSPTIL